MGGLGLKNEQIRICQGDKLKGRGDAWYGDGTSQGTDAQNALEGSDESEDQEPVGPDCDTQGTEQYLVCWERYSMFQVTRGTKGR